MGRRIHVKTRLTRFADFLDDWLYWLVGLSWMITSAADAFVHMYLAVVPGILLGAGFGFILTTKRRRCVTPGLKEWIHMRARLGADRVDYQRLCRLVFGKGRTQLDYSLRISLVLILALMFGFMGLSLSL